MFSPDFYPTPEAVTLKMLEGHDITGKIILEPSAGKGNIIDILKQLGAAEVLSCEINDDLRTIAQTKSKVIGSDFFKVESHHISHIHYIVMNPPFSNAVDHILHAYDIAPNGCNIIALCNADTLNNGYSERRKRLINIVEQSGRWENIGDCFSSAERKTDVNVGLINIRKPGESYSQEFDGFFMEEEPEEKTGSGLMPYNVVRDLVNRYIAAVKLFDQQLEIGVQMNNLTHSFYGSSLAFHCTEKEKPKTRNDFKKDLQKSGWMYIFRMMDLSKTATKGLREDINKFVENQTGIPFTMKNIYRMLEIVIGTTDQRMDKALVEVFDRVTSHSDENKYYHEGWKTNSYYLLNQKFIIPYMCPNDKWNSSNRITNAYGGYFELIEDMLKALCYISGDQYESFGTLSHACEGHDYGELFTWTYFEVRAYKKGTMHFKFLDTDLLGRFNQRIAKIKGYPLFEHKKQKEYTQTVMPTILATISI